MRTCPLQRCKEMRIVSVFSGENSEFYVESVFWKFMVCSYGEISCKTGQNGSIYFMSLDL